MPKLRSALALLLIAGCNSGGQAARNLATSEASLTSVMGNATSLGQGKVQLASIGLDGAGNAVVTGSFQGTIDFGDGKGPYVAGVHNRSLVASITAAGAVAWVDVQDGLYDQIPRFFLAVDASGNSYTWGAENLTKRLPDGSVAWIKLIGGGAVIGAAGVAVDAAGEIFYAGNFTGSVNIHPDGPLALDVVNTQRDPTGKLSGPGAFVSKLNADGSYAWSLAWAPDYGVPFSFGGVECDAVGNIIVLGGFWSAMDYDPTPGIDVLVNTRLNNGGYPAPAATFTRINADRTYGWTQRIDFPALVTAAAVDTDGSIFATGTYNSDCDFDASPDEDIVQYSSGSFTGSEMFVTRLNADGSYGWTRHPQSTPPSTFARSIAVIPGGDVLVAGDFQQPVSFDWDTNGDTLFPKPHSGFVLRTGRDAVYRGTFKLGEAVMSLAVRDGRAGAVGNTVSGDDLSAWSGITPSSPAGSYAFIWSY
jgi:hypothetical protein